MDSQRTVRPSDYTSQIAQANRPNTFTTSDLVESPANSQPQSSQQGPSSDTPSLSTMSPLDRYGLLGLFSTMRSASPATSSLAIGHDLTTLGLDLNSPSPLHPSFATPFAPTPPHRPLHTNFTLPACYNVANITPLHDRINGFADETLFYIFYSQPRDIVQELVAEELVGRKWRYHKVEKMWLTRDESAGGSGPQEVEPGVSEAGWYVWWDWRGWKRVRRQGVLRYEDLDDRERGMRGAAGPGLGGGGGSVGFGGLQPGMGLGR
jgi:CCR4-NOT transcription complex subunit 2